MSDDRRTQGGLSLRTLLIAAAASATAALVIQMFWRPGTVFAAAMTPIIVAIVSEMLSRPVETVSSVRVRRTARGTAILDPPPRDERFDPLAPPPAEDLDALPGAPAAPRRVHRRRPLTARQWKIALVTGLVAFAAAAGLVTASELLAGDAVSGGGRTTFFGGRSNGKQEQPARERDKQQPSAEESATPTPSTTATPEPSATATPTATPTPTVTPAPGTEAPAAPAEPAEPAPTP